MSINQPERRRHHRRSLPWLATAKGVTAQGVAFECAALLHNISEGGASMRIAHLVENGSHIQTQFKRPAEPREGSRRGRRAARGVVLRVEPQPLGTCDVAIQFRPLLVIDRPTKEGSKP